MYSDYKLFLDDERYPPQDGNHYKIARTMVEAISLVEEYGIPVYMSLDHDLGEDLTGYDFVKWLINYHLDYNVKPQYTYYIHSQNPIGKLNMQTMMDSFLKNG